MMPVPALTRHFFTACMISLLAALASSSAQASKDADREAAGIEKLGIGTSFGRWPGGVVVWQYRSTGRPAFYADDAAFVVLLQEAMDEIEAVSGVDFQYQGINNAAAIQDFNDDVVTVGWEDLAGSAGVAGPYTSCTGAERTAIGYCQYTDGSLRFNNDGNDITWQRDTDDASDLLLIQVGMHELLHLLGLGHSDQPDSIMYADPYTSLVHLRDDDISGLRSMYGRSPAPAAPAQYAPPQTTNPGAVADSFVATNDAISTEITSIGDGTTATSVGISWQTPSGLSPVVEMVVEDPNGYEFSIRTNQIDCPFAACISYFSGVNVTVLETMPGTWTFHLLFNGDLVETHTLDNQHTPSVINQAPNTIVAFDRSRGEAPLTINAAFTSLGDAEANNVSGTWHVPTDGETAVDFGGSTGQDTQTFTFTQDGTYEIFVAATDDAPRYGTPGSGSEAGPGFRDVYRKVITVGPISRIVAVPDLNGNGTAEVAVMVEDGASGDNIVYVRDSETDALINTINFGDDPDYDMVVVDANNDGSPEIAVVQTIASGNVRVRLNNALSGAGVNTIFFGSSYSAIDMDVVQDLDANGFPEIAILGRSAAGGIRVQIRDALNDTSNGTSFYGSNSYPVDMAVLPNFVAGTVPAVAVQTRVWASNQTRVQLRNPQTGAVIRNLFFGKDYEPIEIIAVDDVSGDSLPDIAQLSRRIDTGAIRILTKSTANSAPIAASYAGDTDLPMDFASVADINANGSDDFVMLISNPSGTSQVKVWDGSTGGFIRNIFTGSAGAPDALAVLPDGPDAGTADEVAVLGDGGAQNRVQVKDSDSGAQINVIDFP